MGVAKWRTIRIIDKGFAMTQKLQNSKVCAELPEFLAALGLSPSLQL